MQKPVIAIFDVGKTNKKLFLIDENYNIVYERTARFVETVDEDGDSCENLDSLRTSLFESLQQVFKMPEFDIKAVNFSAYGASFVYIDENGNPLTPLYNYLKPLPAELSKVFYATYGGEARLSRETASPILGSLNSGLQFYRLKKERKALFKKVKWALHLPQYLSFLLTGKAFTDLTSVGCHTHLWNFKENTYHQWTRDEGLSDKFGPFKAGNEVIQAKFEGKPLMVGAGLHDSSAALVPYLGNFESPFILLSTGTWCISLNPFNQEPLSLAELQQDCLCYLHYKGKAVKASRIFAGYEHEEQVKRISAHFDRAAYLFKHLKFNAQLFFELMNKIPGNQVPQLEFSTSSAFPNRKLEVFRTAEEAYHQLIFDLVKQQVFSLKLILNAEVKRVFVDGGFGKNKIYMQLLAMLLPELEVYASSVAQATAIGTALAIHHSWNKEPIPNDLIQLKYYASFKPIANIKD